MSLTIAMRNALSGLSLNQFGMSVISNNISNVNTEGYSRKLVQQISLTANGIGAGVDIRGVTRNVDDSLMRELRTQMSRYGSYDVQSRFLSQVQDKLGTPGSASAINSNIGRFGAAFEALGVDPQSTQSHVDLLSDAQRLARQINDMATSAENLRGSADQEIAVTVTRINELAQTIDSLNTEIVRSGAATTGGQSTADLLDRRDQAIRELSELVDVATYDRSDGRRIVTISSSFTLVGDSAATLAYTPASAIGPGTTFNAITVNGSGNLTTVVNSGKLKSLITTRDTTLQNYLAQLDTLAVTLRDQVNAVHNDGVAFPAPRTLTGTLGGLAGATAFAGTGSTRFAVVDASGNVVSAVSVDLTTAANMTQVLAAINAGLGANGTASINASGQLTITATNAAHGIAINEGTGSVTATTRGFSHHFGLNDYFTGTDNAGLNGDLALSIAVHPTLVSNPSAIARGELNITAAATQSGITPGDGSVAQRLAAVFTSNVSFAAVGGLPAMSVSIADFSAAIIGNNATLTARAESNLQETAVLLDNLDFRASSESGVDIDAELAQMTLLENAYNASAQVIRTVNQLFDELQGIFR